VAAADGQPARGAAFVVELPVSGYADEGTASKPASPSMEAVRGAAVLLVEDEEALATAVREALTDAGLKVDYAGDGEDALSRVRNTTYDAVICDLKMPRIDGMTLYRAIAAGTPSLARRVIFVTGDVAGTDAERFLEDSGCRWLAKPFRLADLLRAVRDTLS
jgi:DNA-binding response OmpR family regulator